jgi:hypothetical protein
MGRPANRRDAPALCLLFAIYLALAAAGLEFSWHLDIADPQSLHRVNGRVEQIYHSNLPRTGLKIHIFVREGTGVHHLTQDDPGYTVPAMQTIRTGDSVVALTKPDSLGRDLEWLWSLKRGNEELLSYAQTLHIVLSKAERVRLVAYGMGVLSALLFVCGIALRKLFGAWRGIPGSSGV